MTSSQIRQSFLDFFREKQHTIVPSSSLLPESPNLLFTNAGMNQFVPIFLGKVKCPYRPGRVADTQKCIRAGGKHNDLDDVGLDTYHHTFFEMLGNWSFGDYFKKEAIEWAWELVVERWKFPPQRLYATVYSPDKSKGDPSDFDEEAWEFWVRRFESARLDPGVHIVRGGKKDNFWMMGDTGPCGPCSELHVDLTPAGDTRGSLVNAGDPRCIEIWNLVFIQFNAQPSSADQPDSNIEYVPLAARHVDTGMGFERVTSIIQGTRNFADFAHAKISNYETDIFRPIFDQIEKLSVKRYGSTLPVRGSSGETDQEKIDVAFRVIADHIRTVAFAIADGIEPGNTDRHYVLRRILRRAVRYGRTLGFHEPFFYRLVDVLGRTMGDVFPEIRTNQGPLEKLIRTEEEAFNRTLDRGIALFEAEAQRLGGSTSQETERPEISGAFAFKLYDTYGFPLDLTQLMARERGLTVDVAGFETLMEEQRARARKAQKKQIIELTEVEVAAPTSFVGYDALTAEAIVQEVVEVKHQTAVLLDTSPAYAEMGGQVGDTGEMSGAGEVWKVLSTQKSGQTWLHFIDVRTGGETPAVGAQVTFNVDRPRRRAIERHHTGTHLLHWAIHEVVSRDATQKGSFVGPEKLTFDFNSSALTPAQLRDVERLVNERVIENAGVSWTEVPHAEVKSRSDVMQFFGDKYGDMVRVVQIGGQPRALDGYSMELCAGTHTRATGEIGLFRITSEGAIAAGVRRIEAVAGLNAYEVAHADAERLKRLGTKLGTPLPELEKKLDALVAQQKELEKALKAGQQREDSARADELLLKFVEYIADIPAIIQRVSAPNPDSLQATSDALRSRGFEGVSLLAAAFGDTVGITASVSSKYLERVQANKLIQAIAPVVDGKGGGRPDAARGAGKDPSKLGEALARARALLG